MSGETVWTPQPKQAEFMSRTEFEALFGGAAGGGKSDAIVIEALRQVGVPHYKGLIIRKTYPQLRELIDKSMNYYKKAFPKARWNNTEHTWRFPSGAKIIFGAMQHTQDRLNYQGQSYDYIAFDELTHFTQEEYLYMFSRCRPNGKGTICYIRSTANPGGIGHAWVKERFITAAPPMTTIYSEQTITDASGKIHKGQRDRVFIPSSVFDNQILLENDPNYLLNLASLPTAERNALLYGDWDTFSGQVFTEWRNDPAHYNDRAGTHVIAPFEVPAHWRIWCGLDWGYSRPYSVHWYAVDEDRRIYCIRELYGCTGEPNVGLKQEPVEVAANIKAIEESDPNLKGRNIQRVGDPAIWGTQGPESIGSLFERQRLYFEKGDHSRIDGKMQVHHRLRFDETGRPMLYVFNTCKHLIRTLPTLVYDENNVEDIDSAGEDHAYDELRYVCMRNPIAAVMPKAVKVPVYDPLSTDERTDGRYDFYRRY